MHRFLFGVVYEIESENISVIAIMHLRRRPGYWKRRVRAESRVKALPPFFPPILMPDKLVMVSCSFTGQPCCPYSSAKCCPSL